jgi:DNA-binding transcriptional MerR regulator
MEHDFTIGKLSNESGVKVQTIRYYEEIGLMPEPMRSEGNQRLYGGAQISRLKFIRHARDLGFGLPSIRELLDLGAAPERPCEHADEIAKRHLEDVEDKIVQLTGLKTELSRMVEQCSHGNISDCRVIEILSDHNHCLDDTHSRRKGENHSG